MKKGSRKKKVLLILLILFVVLILSLVGLFFWIKSPISKNEKYVTFNVASGESYSSLGDDLKSAGLIKSSLAYKVYLKLLNPKSLEAGNYRLSSSMNIEQIIETLEKGAMDTRETIKITFIEGKNIRYFISKVTENFNISEEEILNKLSNEEYLDSLIEKYWILTDEIKNKKLYYSLEGYLYPDTYNFYSESTIDDIIEKMINNLQVKLDKYKEEIEESGYTFHQMLTLASIIEQEAKNADDRKGVAGVFYNRLESSWSLGSDVTTYYAEKLELWSTYLYKKEINNCNDYNTRASCMNGKLPVGPICNPSIDSVISAIEPSKHNYYFFVADVYGHTYFNETNSGHSQTVAKLKREGKWYEY